MKNVLEEIGRLLRGLAVMISLFAGGVILVIASLFEKVQGLQR